MLKMLVSLLLLMIVNDAVAFSTVGNLPRMRDLDLTKVAMAKGDDDFMRWARQSRSAGSEDDVVELIRPLGLVLKEDEYRNVYVETVAPKGNAARTGKVRLCYLDSWNDKTEYFVATFKLKVFLS